MPLGSMSLSSLKGCALIAVVAAIASCSSPPPAPPEDASLTYEQALNRSTVIAERENATPALYRDADGWTVFTPSADSRIIYVSSSQGDDGSGGVYQRDDKAIGADPRAPTGAIKPFKTFSAAFKKARDGHPDWILLRRGDTFHGPVAVRNGRALNEPFLLASYGASGPMPLVKTGSKRALEICCKSFNDIAIQGISFYAHTRNFDSPEFKSTDGGSGVFAYVEKGQRGSGLLIEGCRFRFYTGNAIQTDGRLTGALFRRNLVLDNYSTSGHSQGLFARNVTMTVEENIFDHNGWYKQQTESVGNRKGGQATMFNHNTYFQDTRNVIFRENIFLRPASIGTKWTANSGKASTRNVQISNNLYVDGEIGISMGGNEKGPLRFRNITIKDNVLLNLGNSKPTNRDFAWYIDVMDWDQGTVTGNILVHPGSTTSNNIFGIQFTGQSHDVEITGNTIYGFGNGQAINVKENVAMHDINIENNVFYLHKTGRNFVRAKGAIAGMLFAHNQYLSEAHPLPGFSIDGRSFAHDTWKLQVGDRQSTTGINGQIDSANFIERYQRTLGQPASREQFIQALRAQSYPQWDSRYSADTINDWIRNAVAATLPQTAVAVSVTGRVAE